MTDASETQASTPERGGSGAHSNQPFRDFAEKSGDYFADVFLSIQKASLGIGHFNWQAVLIGFPWAALRANKLLFWIGFLIDLVALVYLVQVWKYSTAAAQAVIDQKDFLVVRYEDWTMSSLWAAVIIFVLGRLLFGWLADRIYFRQYNAWRVDHNKPSGWDMKRLVWATVIIAMIAPLMLYRASQFPPDERTCIKQTRAVQAGEEVGFKNRFDCLVISEFPTVVWLDRRDEITYPRDDNGDRFVRREAARADLPPVNLNRYTAQMIDDGIGYLTAFYGFFFDGITTFLRTMLSAITAVFVGTPWVIAMGAILAISYSLAGTRIAAFVAVSLAYLALFGFWQTAMDTMSLVVAASIICIVFGLPLGIWVGKSERGQAIITPILDIMQTIPSFVYLLPAVAFFSIGKPPGILATVIFAMPPMVRLTALGIKHVPENTKEAALAFGANPRQLLLKVELPQALPSIMAGVNQVVMMALSMVVVAALIGAGGMGFIVTEALANTRTGAGILAGIGIAFLAMMIDRVVQKANKVDT